MIHLLLNSYSKINFKLITIRFRKEACIVEIKRDNQDIFDITFKHFAYSIFWSTKFKQGLINKNGKLKAILIPKYLTKAVGPLLFIIVSKLVSF